MRVVIVGGVAGGMSTATRLRRLDANAQIIVLERGAHVSYANCGLPYYVGGVIDDESDLVLQTPASLYERFRLDVRVASEVLDVDAAKKSVTVQDLVSGDVYEVAYDALVLSPGASAIVPSIPGIERAMVLRSVEDVRVMAGVVAAAPRSAAVIGGGFIGVEVAENLRRRGVATTLVEATPQVLAPLDPEMAQLVADELTRHGVDLRLGSSVAAVHEDTVELSSGALVPADMVVVAIGVRPDVGLARRAGLAIGDSGGISVNEYGRTSDPSIYAVGDAVEKRDALDQGATLVPLANVATRQGRVVADYLAGRAVRVVATIGTAIVKVFDLTVATTGWNEKRLVASERPFVAVHTHPTSHATYYPGAQGMSIKLLVDPLSGAILGAQGVGTDGVDKRIDVIATAIRGGLRAPDLADLELAYAPPYGSAKDPVNMLGYVAENVLSGLVRTVQWSDVAQCQSRGAQILDVRSHEEFAEGHLPSAVNIPLDELRDRLDEVGTGEVVVTCRVGQRGHTATLLLGQLGFDAKNLDGGYETWRHSPDARRLTLVG